MPQTRAPAATGRTLLKAAGLVLAAWVVFAPALHGNWVWDDADEIARNRLLRDPAGWWKAWVAPSGPDYFPLKTTVQWVLWHLWGARPGGYHLVNLALHALNGLLFWRLLDRLGVRLAWLGGLLFVVHPLAVESVAWISELKNTLSLFFLLLAMIAYVDYDARRWSASTPAERAPPYALSLLCFVLAMLSKSSVVMFPFVILLHAWWRRRRLARADVAASAPFFAVSLGLGLVTLWFQHHRSMGMWMPPAAGPASRAIAAGVAVAFYLEKCLLPRGLLPLYAPWHLVPPPLLALLPWPALALLLGGLWRKRSSWGAPVLLGLGFFLLNLVPVLGFVSMAYLHFSPVADHFAYISLLGVAGLAAAGAGALCERLAPRRWAGRRWLFALGVALLIGALGEESRGDAGRFRDETTLWTSTVERAPESWMAHKNLAYALELQGRPEAAAAQYEEALRLQPDFPEARNNLGTLLSAEGRYPAAIAQFREALRVDPGYAKAHNNLGIALFHSGQPAAARAEYEAVLRAFPDSDEAHNNLGGLLASRGDYAAAAGEFREALRLQPDDFEARLNLGTVLFRTGDLAGAIAEYAAAAALQPRSPDARDHLGVALAQVGRMTEAREQFAAALRLRPDDARIRTHLENADRALARRASGAPAP
jgi:Flp pilus assembly protein TadD